MKPRFQRVRIGVLGLVLSLGGGVGGSSAHAGRAIVGAPVGAIGFVGTASIGPIDRATTVESLAAFRQSFGDLDATLTSPWLAPSIAAFFANGGRRCFVVRAASESEADVERALAQLETVDEIVGVAAPGLSVSGVQGALLAHAERLGDRVALLDVGPGLSPEEALEARARLSSVGGFGALYYPWVRTRASDGSEWLVPPSGFAAGVWARVDAIDGVPFRSPVEALTGLESLERNLTSAEHELLNPAGVNALRDFGPSGVRVWGARTIASDPEWRFLAVRRFILWLEESIQDGTRWVVFEPNDEPLWARFRSAVEDFALELWRAGALQGDRPEEAFFVRVDRSTMTQADLEAGRTAALVGVAPSRPAEFVIFRVAQERPSDATRFLRADTNGDGTGDLSDAIATLAFLFLGGGEPPCLAGGDTNGDGSLDVSDAVATLGFLFLGGLPPVPPFPACGEFPSRSGDAALGCVRGCS